MRENLIYSQHQILVLDWVPFEHRTNDAQECISELLCMSIVVHIIHAINATMYLGKFIISA